MITVVPLDRLPIFPLRSAVLIPGGVMPLHVFEPRYQAMVADAIDATGLIAIALLSDSPDGGSATGEEPPVAPVVGVGRIHTHQQLDDGRYLLLLHGFLRARIEEELATDKPYRLVRATPLPDAGTGPTAPLEQAANALRQMVLSLARRNESEPAKMLVRACAAERDPGRLADLIGAALLDDAAERQRLLEETSPWRRLQLLTETTANALAQTGSGPQEEPPN